MLRWGLPTVDLFASSLNRKLPAFFSLERVTESLGLHSGLCLPSFSPLTPSGSENYSGPGRSCSDCPLVAQEELVLLSEGPICVSSLAPTSSEGSAPSGTGVTSKPSDLPFDGLEAERRILTVKGVFREGYSNYPGQP